MLGTNGKPHSTSMFSITAITTAGTLMLIAGVIVAVVLRVGAARTVATPVATPVLGWMLP